jgi:hypothetical protein
MDRETSVRNSSSIRALTQQESRVKRKQHPHHVASEACPRRVAQAQLVNAQRIRIKGLDHFPGSRVSILLGKIRGDYDAQIVVDVDHHAPTKCVFASLRRARFGVLDTRRLTSAASRCWVRAGLDPRSNQPSGGNPKLTCVRYRLTRSSAVRRSPERQLYSHPHR